MMCVIIGQIGIIKYLKLGSKKVNILLVNRFETKFTASCFMLLFIFLWSMVCCGLNFFFAKLPLWYFQLSYYISSFLFDMVN